MAHRASTATIPSPNFSILLGPRPQTYRQYEVIEGNFGAPFWSWCPDLHMRIGLTLHGPSSNTMALITPDCDAMRSASIE